MMKPIFSVLIIVLLCSSCTTNNLLKYKWRRQYDESNEIQRDTNTSVVLVQDVCYLNRRVIDGGFCYNLQITIHDTLRATAMQKITLGVDTNVVSGSYGLTSVWHWDHPVNSVTGTVEIKKWSHNKIRLREDLVVEDFKRKGKKKFKGCRTFTVPKQ